MQCPECNGDMFDNRAKKRSGQYKRNAPDFKCKDCGHMEGGFAAKGGGKSGGGERRSAPAGNGGGKEGYWERKEQRDLENQPRIERQHSQEMALRYFDLEQSGAPDTKKLREMISWFQRDIGNSPQRSDEPDDDPDSGEEESPF